MFLEHHMRMIHMRSSHHMRMISIVSLKIGVMAAEPSYE